MLPPIVHELVAAARRIERLERELAHKNWVISQQAERIIASELQRDIEAITAKRKTPALKLVK